MLEKMLKKCYDEEFPTGCDSESVKTAVLSQVEKEKHMKHFKMKPFVIAAVVTAVGALGTVAANAATDGALINAVTKTVKLMFNGNEVEGELKTYTANDGTTVDEFTISIPDDGINYNGGDGPIYFNIDENGNISQTEAPESKTSKQTLTIDGKQVEGEIKTYSADDGKNLFELNVGDSADGVNYCDIGESVYFSVDESGNFTQVPAPTE